AFEPYRGRLNPNPSALAENAESIGARLAGGYGLAAVAEGGIVGCVLVSLEDPKEAYIGRLAVLPIWRGRGIGRRLMEGAEEAARARGCAAMSLGVRLVLSENIAFFERLGFRRVREECHPGFLQPTFATMAKRP
ncbi:MAG TPA: GNAT family N-acetyltransferase, partial [Alphaproteobacteria bacterium]|nr:GNAT family N-acetyltransferase [Alphaproteobacteria bacterium]